MIHVIATITANPGRRADLLAAFRDLVPLVRAEVGCIEYGTAIDVDTTVGGQKVRENVVTVVEKWESITALQDHLAAPHMLAYKQKVKDIVAGVEIRVLEPA